MKISIITATFNSASTLSDCIASVYHQSYGDIEHLIVDGESKDDGLSIIHSQPNRVQKVVTIPSAMNIYDALNKGIALAEGEIVGFLHSDDVFASNNVLSKVAEAFATTNVEIVYGNIVYVDPKNPHRVIRTWKSNPFRFADLKKGWMPPHTAFFTTRKAYKKYGDYDSSLRIAGDYDLMYRYLALHRIPSHFLDITMVRMRHGGTSNKTSNMLTRLRENYRVIRRYHIGGIVTLVFKNLRKIEQYFGSKN